MNSIGLLKANGEIDEYANTASGGGGSANIQEIDYATFDQKSQAEKDNGTLWLIPDVPIVPDVPIKSWASATDEELVQMIDAADRGIIDLYDDAGWRVGDERVVHLSAMSATGVGESHAAQDVTFVLMHRGLYKDVNDKTVNFVVGMKDCLAEGGYMNSTSTNTGSWGASARRTWCNNVFKNAIPSTLIDIFKQVKVTTAKEHDSTQLEVTNDYFFLPASAEVTKGDSNWGTGGSAGEHTTAWSNLTEFNALTRFTHYMDTSNWAKGHVWWCRSPVYGKPTEFAAIAGTNLIYTGYASYNEYYLSVHGCI